MILTDFLGASVEPVSHNERIQKHVLLKKGQCANIMQLARSVFPPGEIVPDHAHEDMVEVFMVREGTGRIVVNDKPYDLKKDNCVVVESGDVHALMNIGQEKLVIDYFGLQVSKMS
ncbi:MAG: cupin domain-containing protein [Planctomycetota bacterium]|jgi:mannose-6-phosphate isomerase-like protein (cupin superfamily)